MDLIAQLKRVVANVSDDKDRYYLEAIARILADVAGWKPAPREIPFELVDGFSMMGQIPITRCFRDDTIIKINQSYDSVKIELFLESILYTKDQVDGIIEMVRGRRTFHYGMTDTWLYQSFDRYPIAAKRVAVLGSGCPVYEAMCLALNATPITVEYQIRISDDDRLTFLSPEQFATGGFPVDAALAVSAFEHDGLGRYGDPLDPDGDLKAMANVAKVLPEGGLLYLTVPFQHDVTLWNVNRHYGPVRLPHLLKGFTLLDTFGPPDGLFLSLEPLVIDAEGWRRYFNELGPGSAPEWVLVLRNNKQGLSCV